MASLLCHWSVGTLAVGPLNPGIITLTSSIKTSEQGKGSKNTQDLRSVLKKAGAFLEIEEMDTLKMAGKHTLEGIVGSPLPLPARGRRGGWNGWRRAHRGSEIWVGSQKWVQLGQVERKWEDHPSTRSVLTTVWAGPHCRGRGPREAVVGARMLARVRQNCSDFVRAIDKDKINFASC